MRAPRPAPGSKAPVPAAGPKAAPKGPLAALLESVQNAADASTASQPAAQGTDRAAHAFLPRESAVLERILTQNASVETVLDFKYWDDPSDAARPQEGSLLPLWTFAAAAAGPQTVTALAWCPGEPDVFAVGHGSFDPAKRQTGTLAVHSLRAPSRPQLVCPLPTSVLCLAFHPVFDDTLAVGCQDGVIRVLRLRGHLGGSERPPPLYTARPELAGHREPVWQELVTLSVAVTGGSASDSDDELSGAEHACPSAPLAMDYQPAHDDSFLVGTEHGLICRCSASQTGAPLQTVHGHSLAVYAARRNPCHPRLVLSASADWTVKLWDLHDSQELRSYNLKSPVGDAAWLPIAPTVFAAVTENGWIHVVDLAQNPWQPLCVQKLVNKTKLTKLAFNPVEPIVIVGDDRGIVSCLKLSPNLRKRVEASAQYRSEAGISSDSPLQVFGALPFKPPAARTLLGERVSGPGSAAVPVPAPAAVEVALPSAEEVREAWCQAHRRQLEGPLEALRRVRSSVQKALDG